MCFEPPFPHSNTNRPSRRDPSGCSVHFFRQMSCKMLLKASCWLVFFTQILPIRFLVRICTGNKSINHGDVAGGRIGCQNLKKRQQSLSLLFGSTCVSKKVFRTVQSVLSAVQNWPINMVTRRHCTTCTTSTKTAGTAVSVDFAVSYNCSKWTLWQCKHFFLKKNMLLSDLPGSVGL